MSLKEQAQQAEEWLIWDSPSGSAPTFLLQVHTLRSQEGPCSQPEPSPTALLREPGSRKRQREFSLLLPMAARKGRSGGPWGGGKVWGACAPQGGRRPHQLSTHHHICSQVRGHSGEMSCMNTAHTRNVTEEATANSLVGFLSTLKTHHLVFSFHLNTWVLHNYY